MKKVLFLLALVFTGTVSAKPYLQGGYITEVKINHQGKECNIGLSTSLTRKPFQKGKWDCSSQIGSDLLSIAKMASVLGSLVYVSFEGNGQDYKPVYSINVINHQDQ